MNEVQFPSARTRGLVVQEMADETLVYDLDINKAHCLNDTASQIWKLCDGNTSIAQIVSQLEQNSRSPVQEELVWLAIDQLSANDLLEAGLSESKLIGQSRREVLKKIGLATVIAIPVVASLVAPNSVLAGSSCFSPCASTVSCTNPSCTVCVNSGVPVLGCQASCPPLATCS